MKFSSIMVGAFAALTTAAPVEKRSGFNGNQIGQFFGNGFDANLFNGGVFQNDIFAYLFQLNGLQNQDVFDIFNIGKNQGLALDIFSPLFNIQQGGAFGINEILLAQSFLTLGWLHKNNLIGNVAFGGIGFPSTLDFGLFQGQFDGFKDFGFGQLDVGFGNQIGAIIASSGINLGVGHLGFSSGLGLGVGFKE